MSSTPSKLGSHRREIIVILWLILAIFTWVSVLYPGSTGIVGHILVDLIFIQSFGGATPFLPAFLVIGSIALMTPQTQISRVMSALAACFGFFCIFTELTLRGPIDILRWPFPVDGGGWIGHLGLFICYRTVGINGTWIFLIGTLILSLMLIFNASFFLTLKRGILWLYKGLRLIPYKKSRSFLKSGFVGLFFSRNNTKANLTPALQAKQKSEWARSLASLSTEDPVSEDSIKEEPEDEEIIDFEKLRTPIATSKATKKNIPNTTYKLPSISLLEKGKKSILNSKEAKQDRFEQAQILEDALRSFKVEAKVVNVTPGPSVTRYELEPGEGVKVNKITTLAKDIALKLAAHDVRIEAPIPGKSLVGIEVPNKVTQMITLRSMLTENDFYSAPSRLLTGLGLTITGESIYMNLGKMPHILIAGATGAGKSVCINTIILSILMKARPDEVKFLMIDPKKVELSLYNDIPHLLAPVVTDPHMAAATLKRWALVEMERRYEIFSKMGVKEIEGFNRKIVELEAQNKKDEKSVQRIFESVYGETNWEEIYNSDKAFSPLPYIVVIIDELADLMMVASQEVETTICRLAQMARATGIHLVIATQRPSVNVITGLIKANVPSRISFFLQSQIDSRTILDSGGAEKLLGKGDMLYLPVGAFKPKRLQGVFISEHEVKAVVEHIKAQASPDYEVELDNLEPVGKPASDASDNDSDGQDELFEQAKELVASTQYASTSFLQRKLRIGYNRAARLMDELEESGVISPYDGEKKARVVNI